MPAFRVSLGAALLAALALSPAAHAAAPTFSNYYPPSGVATDAGEPSIGYNPKTGATLFQSFVTTLKVTGFDGQGHSTWTDVTEPTAITSLDPILWTDRDTGRTISSQLLLACSKAAITDTDGASWLPSEGCGAGTGIDHQTIGGGPFAGVLKGGTPLYPNAVYYCTQDGVVAAHCAMSPDGGFTFGPEREIYTFNQCPLLLHGHLKVGPDGTAYVPTADCDGHAAMAESTDNGTTWAVDEVPGSTSPDQSDPSLGIGDKGSLYLGWQGADGQDLGNPGNAYFSDAHSESRAWISVKPAGSSAWRAPIDVGASLGIKNTEFPEVFAGDDNRVAYAFLGTTTTGDEESASFKGAWHLYVAYSYDGGLNWTTVDATPTDPVQRGCIWLQGGSSACRNLLDFNDITIDNNGRVMVAYADGCTGGCVTADPATYDYSAGRPQQGVIARQESGLGLYAAKDPVMALAAPVAARQASLHVHAPPATRTGDDGDVREHDGG
jgi:hypothetical protein